MCVFFIFMFIPIYIYIYVYVITYSFIHQLVRIATPETKCGLILSVRPGVYLDPDMPAFLRTCTMIFKS